MASCARRLQLCRCCTAQRPSAWWQSAFAPNARLGSAYLQQACACCSLSDRPLQQRMPSKASPFATLVFFTAVQVWYKDSCLQVLFPRHLDRHGMILQVHGSWPHAVCQCVSVPECWCVSVQANSELGTVIPGAICHCGSEHRTLPCCYTTRLITMLARQWISNALQVDAFLATIFWQVGMRQTLNFDIAVWCTEWRNTMVRCASTC